MIPGLGDDVVGDAGDAAHLVLGVEDVALDDPVALDQHGHLQRKTNKQKKLGKPGHDPKGAAGEEKNSTVVEPQTKSISFWTFFFGRRNRKSTC